MAPKRNTPTPGLSPLGCHLSAHDGFPCTAHETQTTQEHIRRIKVYFDGGRRENLASCGWTVLVSGNDSQDVWHVVSSGAKVLGDTTVVSAELAGANDAIRWALQYVAQLWQTA